MTKKEFIEILKQVKESFKNNIYQQKKEILGLVDDVQLLPFNEISLNLFPYGYYWKDNNDEWRVNMFLNDDSKEQAKELENKKGLKFTNHRERAKIEEEINIIPSYEVNFEMKCIPDSYDFPSIIIDNKTIFEICINEKPKTMAERWNKTLLEHYKEMPAKKYETYLEAFYEWFADKEIDIEKVGSLIEPEIESGMESKKRETKTTKRSGGRPKDPKLPEKKKNLCKEYYQLTEKKGLRKKHAIKKLSGKYNWAETTIKKYIK